MSAATQPGLTLILGGARAGKTALAERLAARHGPAVLYVATAEPGDAEMQARIAAHRAARPPAWQTLEAPLDPARALSDAPPADAAIVDCLTIWTSNHLLRAVDVDHLDAAGLIYAERSASTAVDALLDWQKRRHVPLYVVSNEVGLGVVPPYPLGRAYQDLLGRMNQRVAARADRVYLVVAGLALDLRALGAISVDALPPLPIE